MSLIITERVAPSFDDIMTDPKREAYLSAGGLLGQGALGVDYMLTLGRDEEGEGGLLIGIRAGYILSFFGSKWEMGNIDVAGGPKIGISGFYIRFIFGGGGYELPR